MEQKISTTMKVVKLPKLPKREKAVTREVDCTLSQGELANKGKLLGVLGDQREKLTEEKLEWLKIWKERDDNVRVTMGGIRKELRTGVERRMIDCKETYDFAAGTVTVVRLDTNAVIEEREMTLAEKQVALDDWGGKSGNA